MLGFVTLIIKVIVCLIFQRLILSLSVAAFLDSIGYLLVSVCIVDITNISFTAHRNVFYFLLDRCATKGQCFM